MNANAAPGNTLTRVTIYLGGSYFYWNVASPTAYQVWNLPALAPGVYTIFATTQDNQGHITTTPAVRFVVNGSSATPPTGVAITSPFPGASFISPETVSMTATASPASGKTISSVSFYAGRTWWRWRMPARTRPRGRTRSRGPTRSWRSQPTARGASRSPLLSR
ncbi:MAG: hypothetical protein IPP91_12590 [Betaproteobacteria bacterium]|nr:hypothetical protein [Betaproteobacteria bacterium]